jgi:Flp pilus assembly protein TadG
MRTHIRRILNPRRRAATLLESAVVLPVCLFMLLGMIELTIVLVRHTVMAEAARRVARAAMVHGASALPSQGQWGPAPLDLDAADDHLAAAIARDVLMTLEPSQVQISVRWPDADNESDDRVEVNVTLVHQPMVTFPGFYDQLTLSGRSVMRIAH